MPDSAEILSPAERFRARILQGQGRFSVLVATTLIWTMDTLVQRRLEAVGLMDSGIGASMIGVERVSTYVATEFRRRERSDHSRQIA